MSKATREWLAILLAAKHDRTLAAMLRTRDIAPYHMRDFIMNQIRLYYRKEPTHS